MATHHMKEIDLADLLAADLYDASVAGQGRTIAPPWMALDLNLREHWTRIAVEAVSFVRRMDAYFPEAS
jgi:hypothetical protein